MMPIEIEHPAGQKELTRLDKLEAKKWRLKQAFGEEKYNRLMGYAKGFFEANKKEVIGR